MQLLVFNESTRCVITLAPTATGAELKAKVAAMAGPAWPPETQLLQLNGEVIRDDETLSAQNVADRDKVHLSRQAPTTETQAHGGQPSQQFDAALQEVGECAALLDDYANVLTSGKPTSVRAADDVPSYGGARAREESWRVLDKSRNTSWAHRWRASCDAVESGAPPSPAVEHDEL